MNPLGTPAAPVVVTPDTTPVPASAREWRAISIAVRAETDALARRGAPAADLDVARAAASYGRYLERWRQRLSAATVIAVLLGSACAVLTMFRPSAFGTTTHLPGADLVTVPVLTLALAAAVTTAARVAISIAARKSLTGDVNLARITAASPYPGTPRTTARGAWWRVIVAGRTPFYITNVLWALPILAPSHAGQHLGLTGWTVRVVLMGVSIGNLWRTRYLLPMSWRDRETVIDERGITLTGWRATVPWADVTRAWASGSTITWELRPAAYLSSYTSLPPRHHPEFRRLFAANVLTISLTSTGVAAETILRTTYAYVPAADVPLIPALARRTGAR